MVKNYSPYIRNLRTKYVRMHDMTFHLPATKNDCTCITDINRASILNAPPSYCAACNNVGYILSRYDLTTSGVLCDYVSDSNQYPHFVEQFDAGDFNQKKYVIHIDSTCLSIAGISVLESLKLVTIDLVEYRILSIDPSTQLGQIRLLITVCT